MEKYGYIRDKLIHALSELAFSYAVPKEHKAPTREYVDPPKRYWKLLTTAAGAVLGGCVGGTIQVTKNTMWYVMVALFALGFGMVGLLVGVLADRKISADAGERLADQAYRTAVERYEAEIAEDHARVEREKMIRKYLQAQRSALEQLPKAAVESAEEAWDQEAGAILRSVDATARTATQSNPFPADALLSAFIAEYPQ